MREVRTEPTPAPAQGGSCQGMPSVEATQARAKRHCRPTVATELPPPSLYCSCEHFGSQYDGICAVSTNGDANILSYQWEAYGNAWMPYPSDQRPFPLESGDTP